MTSEKTLIDLIFLLKLSSHCKRYSDRADASVSLKQQMQQQIKNFEVDIRLLQLHFTPEFLSKNDLLLPEQKETAQKEAVPPSMNV
jgi:hypothetical protein